jgi:hypothetical protein
LARDSTVRIYLHVRDLPACQSFLKFEFIFLFVIK